MERKDRDYKAEWENQKSDPEVMAAKRAHLREHYANNLEAERARSRAKYAANKEYYRQKHAEWWAAHPEKAREYGVKKRELHPERERARAKNWAANNADYIKSYQTQKRNGPNREQILKVMRYGAHKHYLSREKFEGIYPRLLDGPCEICGAIGPMKIDHCHERNLFRGVICDGCNRGLGYFKDNPAALRKAADYLERTI